ncbi:hypothetical protein BWQ96_02139 [Gracilariopsis chorda]|uniref:MgtC/SapB/SrpB/YhiD N-terminal domain-containing protein n=1 Tax=Gracilariopsis chorda TaxID=448386 RepID=A0A2V3J2F7_9FLOR|nr:hypothetical protein BWQ96_02139 [Gracilariopsis chorda]|eukprot:PXF48187.1 hypothetical protein BWQ96_02139 [Gracilariopsis chorda]
MTPSAFLSPLPVNVKSAPSFFTRHGVPSPFVKRPSSTHNPTCSLTNPIRTAAAALAAVTISLLPLGSTSASSSPSLSVHPQQHEPVLVTYAASERLCAPPPVVGVAKSPIHDYSIPQPNPTITNRYSAALESLDPVDEARRELSLATRLVTAVLLGAIVGVERSATQLNLGVRSITLISLSSAVVCVMLSSVELPLQLMAVSPHMAVASAAAVAGIAVFAMATLRRPRPRNVSAMSWIVTLCVTMGGACGAGSSLLTVFACLAAVYVMRISYTPPVVRKRIPVPISNIRMELDERRDDRRDRERYMEFTASSAYDGYSSVRAPDAPDGQSAQV